MVVGDGCGASAVRGGRYLQALREGVCADSGKRQEALAVDSDDMGAVTSQILALREHLAEQKVTCVVMETTSD